MQPPSVVQTLTSSNTTDSALMIFLYVNLKILKKFVIIKFMRKNPNLMISNVFGYFYLLKMSCTVSFVRTLLV